VKPLVIASALLLLAACGVDRPSPSTSSQPNDAPASNAGESGDWFIDRAAEAGLDFVHVNGMSGRLYMAEILAPGVAVFDYDNDGDLDAYLVQGEDLNPALPATRPPRVTGASDRLYRNDLQVHPDGTRVLRFTDVTDVSGIVSRGYGMGVATGDFDNDGRVDLYLTKFDAPNQLFRNNGDGTFTDVSASSGTDQRSWSVSASFVDIDRDGWLDLYVGNYVRYRLDGATTCFSASGAPDYCTPRTVPALPDRLYRNQRNGTFADVSASARIAGEFGPALGVSTADFNGDGWLDIYVANDGKENQLWLNRRDGTFDNAALLAGVALPDGGKAEASMGVDAGDLDDDGDEDLFMTELTGEGSNLFVNDGTGLFVDASGRSGLGPPSLAFTGFGTGWLDFDGDGRLDLLAVNGAVQVIEPLRQARDPLPLHQRKLLFRNVGGGRFEDVSARAGAAFQLSEVGRGAAFGDVDNDGDVDVLVGNNNGPTRLFINEAGRGRHWIGLRLTGERGARDMLGARVEIIGKRGSLWRRARADGSYASASDPRVLAGLGDSAEPPAVRVRWPSGRVEMWNALPVDRYTTVREGEAP
jgi:enediyne biosynthesis protein E4